MSDSETLERLKAERLRAERQARHAAERERLAIQHAEERAAFERAETWPEPLAAGLAARLEAERAASVKAALDKRAKLWDEHEAESVPVAEMSPPFEGEIIGIWTVQPKQPRSVESRLAGLVESVMEIIAMDGQPDWRGLLAEALEDATA
jgi:hypothetical protein